MQNILFDYIEKYIDLSDEERNTLESFDLFHTVEKGTVLLEPGQLSNKGYFVLKGCLRIYYNIDGDEKTTAFYTELDVLTPNCAINKTASEYSISCVEDSILLISSPDMEEEMFNKFPKFETLCRVISEQLLAKSQITLDDFKTSSPEQRYLKLLKNRPDLLQRVPQHQLASFLGITPQSLSRLRARINK